MGEVYKGRDTRLDRLVAIKVLSSELSASADARDRFEREAKAISHLSHPNICALFDVGTEGDRAFLVMELLDGETLAALIARGPIPMTHVLDIGGAIAEALAAAHRQGIVHRDLKPGNVLITKTGVKLLDFGLAKTIQKVDHSAAATAAALTAPGTWLGTAPYMSPEQIDGRAIEGRSDIFALGAVLYEMATGKRAFDGQSSSAIAAGILHSDPGPVSAAIPNAPPSFDRLVRTCLAKDPERRWQSAHDVSLMLDAIAAETRTPRETRASSSAWLPRLGWVAALVATLVAAWALTTSRRDDAAAEPLAFEISPPAPSVFVTDVETVRFALSPDGSQLVFVASDASGPRLWKRQLSSTESTPIPGTEGAASVFWSPDSRAIAFFAGDTLKRLDLATGAAVAICKVQRGIGLTGSWSASGDILFASVEGHAIYRVPVAGGTAAIEVKPDPTRDETRVAFPAFLPDGKRYLYSVKRRDATTSLLLGESGKQPKLVGPIDSNAQFVKPGTLVFARAGALVGQPFDPASGQLGGEPVAIANSVRFFLSSGLADFSTAVEGTIVYQSHSSTSRLAWIDRAGRELSSLGAKGDYYTVRISPQQRSALVSRTLKSTGTYDVWSLEFDRGSETRLTLDDQITEVAGVLLPDEQAMIFGLARGTPPNLARMDFRSGQTALLSAATNHLQEAEDITRDGRLLGYDERTEGGFQNIWTVSLDGTGQAVRLHQTPFNEEGLRFAPDGRHYSFTSNESGRNEVYVAALGSGSKTIVSSNGGVRARWSGDGRTLYYQSSDRRLMAVPIQFASTTLAIGRPTTLFAISSSGWIDFDVTRDDQRFLAIIPDVVVNVAPLTALQHWNVPPK
jgi:serine/threonine protein kinase